MAVFKGYGMNKSNDQYCVISPSCSLLVHRGRGKFPGICAELPSTDPVENRIVRPHSVAVQQIKKCFFGNMCSFLVPRVRTLALVNFTDRSPYLSESSAATYNLHKATTLH